MATYAIWNNKGGVGKSYLTFQLGCEYARIHPDKQVFVIDLCPQSNSSGMFLGGMDEGEAGLDALSGETPPKTISGYIEDRIVSPYVNPRTGARYLTAVHARNPNIPPNVRLVPGDEQLEVQASRVLAATNPGPDEAWRLVHTWISDLIVDLRNGCDRNSATVFIDCNPSFSIYTELALSAADNLVIPFSADGSSRRAVRSVLALVYGVTRRPGLRQSEFFLNSDQFRMRVPRIYRYVGNRLTQYNHLHIEQRREPRIKPAKAFKAVVEEIGNEIWDVWESDASLFQVHPSGTPAPRQRRDFERMFQAEIPDANTASVVSTALGIPIGTLNAGMKTVVGKEVMVNQTQLDRQQPAMNALAKSIE